MGCGSSSIKEEKKPKSVKSTPKQPKKHREDNLDELGPLFSPGPSGHSEKRIDPDDPDNKIDIEENPTVTRVAEEDVPESDLPPTAQYHPLQRRGSSPRVARRQVHDEPGEMVSVPKHFLRTKLQDRHLRQLTRTDTATLNSLFDGIQEEDDASATLNKEKFVTLMISHGHGAFGDQTFAESFFEAMDANRNGSVDKKELLVGMLALTSGSTEEKLRVWFKIYDINNDNAIQTNELTHMLKVLQRVNGDENMTDEFIDEFCESTYATYGNEENELCQDDFVKAAIDRQDLCTYFTALVQPSSSSLAKV